MSGWIGVDLDGTLAHYEGWDGGNIGEPIPLMVNRVKGWLSEGKTVKILTARISHDPDGTQRQLIQDWAQEHIGERLEVTNCKRLWYD